MVVFVLIASAKFVNRDTFQYLGYYNNIVSTRTYFAEIKYFKENKWATSCKNVSLGIFDQVRLKPACSAVETS